MTGVCLQTRLIFVGEKHEKTCGGKFHKIAEPEGYVDKTKTSKIEVPDDNQSNLKIDKFFPKIDNKVQEEEKELPLPRKNKKRTKEEANIGDPIV